MKYLLSTLITIFALAILTSAAPILAQEDVCSLESGAAFGLCNAYCEAMDCDSDDPQASATACDKIAVKFMNATGQDLPCESTLPQAGDSCTAGTPAIYFNQSQPPQLYGCDPELDNYLSCYPSGEWACVNGDG